MLVAAVPVRAREPIRIGVIAPFTGPFADYGKQFEAGVKAFQKVRGDIVAGREVRVIVQTIYVRRVEKRNGELWNIKFDKFDNVADPGKQP